MLIYRASKCFLAVDNEKIDDRRRRRR